MDRGDRLVGFRPGFSMTCDRRQVPWAPCTSVLPSVKWVVIITYLGFLGRPYEFINNNLLEQCLVFINVYVSLLLLILLSRQSRTF